MSRHPSVIVSEFLREEKFARAHLRRWRESRNTEQFTAAIHRNPALRTESMARLLLDFVDEHFEELLPVEAQRLVEAAITAAEGGDAWIQCRAWKDLANVLRSRAFYGSAAEAVERAATFAARTHAVPYFTASVEYARAALAHDTGRIEEALSRLKTAISGFEDCGDLERAYSARLFRVSVNYKLNLFAECAADHEAAIKHAYSQGNAVQAALQLGNLSICLVRMGDLDAASLRIQEALGIFEAHGCIVAHARNSRVAAMITMRRVGIGEGLLEMERVRQACLDLSLFGDALRCLISAAETLHEIDPSNDELPNLHRDICNKAAALQLSAAAADAAERLTEAHARGAVTSELLREVWRAVDPSAALRSEMTN